MHTVIIPVLLISKIQWIFEYAIKNASATAYYTIGPESDKIKYFRPIEGNWNVHRICALVQTH